MSKAGVSFERVDYIIGAEEEAYQDKKEYEGQSRDQGFDIGFSHVNYGYKDGKEVLSDVTFSIPRAVRWGSWAVPAAASPRSCSFSTGCMSWRKGREI